ncbi:MAG: hypothetical protein SFZ02_18515 [bacterium]|nr:hypothetical protein [bacterium]
MNFHDYKTLENRLNETNIQTLIADCDALLAIQDDEFMRLLRSALSLSAHVLEKDKSALAHQLAGRLYHHVDKNADIKAFVDGIIPPKNSLYPIYNGYDPLLPAGGMLINILKHNSTVLGTSQLSNGNIISWDKDNTLHLWHPEGQLINTLVGHQSPINEVLILQNDHILSCDANGMLQLWDSDGLPLKTLKNPGENDGNPEHIHQKQKILKLLDGCILSWHYDTNNLLLWDEKGENLAQFIGHTAYVRGALQLIDGRILSWSKDFILCLWDTDGHLLKTLIGHQYPITNVQILTHQHNIVSEDMNMIFIWDMNGELIKSDVVPQKRRYKRYVLSDGRLLYWNDRQLLLRDNEQFIPFTGHTGFIRGVLELSDGRILSWSTDFTLRIWNKMGEQLKILETHSNPIDNAIQLSDSRIVSSGFNGHAFLWDSDGNFLASLKSHVGSPHVYPLIDGRLLTRWANLLYIWDTNSQAVGLDFVHNGVVVRVIGLDDDEVLSSDRDNLYLWDKNGQLSKNIWRYNSWGEQDTILNKFRMISVARNHFFIWRMNKKIYKLPSSEYIAVELPNGWRLLQPHYPILYLQDENETIISEIREDYAGNLERIFAWLREYNINPDDAYPDFNFPNLKGLRVKCHFSEKALILYDPQNGKTIYTFHGDMWFTSVIVIDDIVIAGDSMGRVIFLRWVE